MSRAWLISGVLCFGIALTLQTRAASMDLRCDRCNVLLINLDFLRADYVGLTSGGGATPNTDNYFRNSIIFENAYSPAGSTYRGDVSVFTATSPHFYNIDVKTFSTLKIYDRLGAWRRIFMAPMTIAQILSKHGYDTSSLNKGNRSGRYTFLNRGFHRYKQFPLRLLIEDSLPVLIQEIRSAHRPFLIHYHAIPTRLHRAFYPIDRDRVQDPDIRYFEYKRQGRPYGYKIISDHGAPVERQRLAEHKIYRQQLVYADEVLASLYRELKAIEDDTIIVFISNHGTQLGDQGVFASNGVSYESSIRVPLLIKHPKVRQPVRVSTPVSLIDLVPTLTDMLGIDMSDHVHDGISLVPTIQTGRYSRNYLYGKNDPDEYVRLDNWKMIIETDRDRRLYRGGERAPDRKDYFGTNEVLAHEIEFQHSFGFLSEGTITDGPWELQVADHRRYLLYDLSTDPHEEHDLSARFPDVVNRLKEIADREHRKAEARIQGIVGGN